MHILPGHLIGRFDYVKDCENVSSLTAFNRNVKIKSMMKNVIVFDADVIFKSKIPQITQVRERFFF